MIFKLSTLLFVISGVAFATQYDGRIINGTVAVDSHIFAVRVISAVNNIVPEGSLCSGVAVTERHIVTVAQAIFGFGVWYIRYGSIHVNEQRNVTTQDAVISANYNPLFLHDNIGVIRVPDNVFSYLPIGFDVILPQVMVGYGYGFINTENQLAATLKRAVMSSQNLAQCQTNINSVVVRNDNFCATSPSEIQSGDQGGPVTNPMVTQVLGIISFWGTSNGPIVMLDLREHRLFLEAQLAV